MEAKQGIVYHVVDNNTNQVVKVGSTIQTLKRRFNRKDYRDRYTHHRIIPARVINSSPEDEYQKGNPFCPFLWHLVAIETLEILKQNTFQKQRLSNWQIPLLQKLCGFDGVLVGSIGGKIGGRTNANSGHLDRIRTYEGSVRGGIISGAMMKAKAKPPIIKKGVSPQESGHKQGLINAENGHLKRLDQGRKNALKLGYMSAIGKIGGKKGGVKACHFRWHVQRNKYNHNCNLCVSQGEV